MAERTPITVIRFGLYEANLRSSELYKHGIRVRVPGQAFKILTLLLERPGEVVTRDELQSSLWPAETFVDFEHSLNSAIKKLREALRDSADRPRYIETVPRIGYRFIAPLAVGSAAAQGATTLPEPSLDNVPLTEKTPAAPAIPEAAELPAARGIGNNTEPGVPPKAEPPARRRFDGFGASIFARKTGGSAWRMRHALAWAALAVTLVVATSLFLRSRRGSPIPFEVTTIAKLTSAGQSRKAVISPDGRYIAHTLIKSGQESLRVRRATTVYDIEIVPPAPVHYLGMTFSPDSEAVYYVTHTAEAAPAVLSRVPVMGGPSEKLKQDLASPITFSPDGTKYAFVRESAGESSLIVADLASGKESKLTGRKLPEALDYPAWSPDGRAIACTDVDSSRSTPAGSEARIIEVRVAGGSTALLSRQTWGFIKDLAWLGDQRGLVMSARGPESNIFHIWYLSYPGGAGRRVSEGLDHQVGASVSRNSRQIVTVEETTLAGIWRLRRPWVGDPDPVASGSTDTAAPAWMPDGRILFERQLNGADNIWAVGGDGAGQRQVTLLGNNYAPSVSSDGRVLACVSDRSGSPAIWTMDSDGSNPVMVVKAFGNAVPELSPDGKWIVFTTFGSGQLNALWLVGARGGKARQLSNKTWRRPVISPDGKWIAGFYADRQLSTNEEPTNIALIPIGGGEPRKVIPIPLSVSISAGLRWSPDSLRLTYVDHRTDGDNVWNLPLNGGQARQLTQFHGEALFGFDWSRDGRQLVFNRGIQARDVVLIQQVERK